MKGKFVRKTDGVAVDIDIPDDIHNKPYSYSVDKIYEVIRLNATSNTWINDPSNFKEIIRHSIAWAVEEALFKKLVDFEIYKGHKDASS
jgi:hypothetical protein